MTYLWQFYLLIIVILIQGISLLSTKKIGKVGFVIICFIELSFIAGFRSWNIGNDTNNYIQAFMLSTSFPELMKTHMEYGYLLYNRTLAHFTLNPQMLLITTSIFIIGSWLYTIYKYSSSILLSTLLFVILEFSTTLTMIRQEMAICIILLSFPLIIKRQFFPFLVVCFLASTMHSSAIIAIGIYFLYNLPFKRRYIMLAVCGTVLSFVFLAPIIEHIISIMGRYESYKGNILLGSEAKVASVMKTAIQLAIMTFCCLSYKYQYRFLSNPLQSRIKVSFLLWCSVIAACLQFISIRGTVMERLVIYVSAFNFISIPYFVRTYWPSARIIIFMCLLICFIAYKSIVFVYRPEWNYVLPFEFCF